MKLSTALLYVLVTCSVFFANCKKEKESINTNEVRLLAIEMDLSNGTIDHTNIHYSSSGKIEKITQHNNTDAPETLFSVSYVGNEIILTRPPENNASLVTIDSIKLFLNASNRLEKRLSYSFYEFKAPVSNPQRTYTYDTTTYEYDAAGILKKETLRYLDTTWTNFGTGQTYATRIVDITDHNITEGNTLSTKTISKTSIVTNLPGRTFITNRSKETNNTFEYTKAYSNQTDFSNAAILNELNLQLLPLNQNNRNLPNKITGNTVEMDGNGIVTNNYSYTSDQQFTYTSYGFISAKYGAASPNLKTRYVYNK